MSTLAEVLARETREGDLYDTLPDGRLRCYACGHCCPLPEGAFYAFPDARETGMSSVDLGAKLLQEARVAATPGIAFGEAGEGHFRISFATADNLLEEAVQRIGDALGWR